MNKKIEEIRELLAHILKKLEAIELKIERQEEDVKTYLKDEALSLDSKELLLAHQKSTRTSVELLRDEIEELHQLMKIIFHEINNCKGLEYQ
jgi:hypothetical protein